MSALLQAKDSQELRAALEELLDVAERMRGGDPNLDPEQWYATRDYARVVLAKEPTTNEGLLRLVTEAFDAGFREGFSYCDYGGYEDETIAVLTDLEYLARRDDWIRARMPQWTPLQADSSPRPKGAA